MKETKITIPIEPVGWDRLVPIAGGRKSKKQRIREVLLMRHLKQALSSAGVTSPFIGGVAFNINYYFEIPHSWDENKRCAARRGEILHLAKPDFDNCGKTLMDCLSQLNFWTDDSHYLGTFGDCFKHYAEEPRYEIVIRCY